MEVTNKNGKSKKKLLISMGIVVVSALALFLWYNFPIFRFKTALAKADFSQAEEVYRQNNSSKRFVDKAQKIADDYIEKEEKEFLSHTVSYDKAVEVIDVLSDFATSSLAKQRLDNIQEVKESWENFALAQKAEDEKDYLTAINYYLKIKKQDVENYDSAQQGIERITDFLCNNDYALLAFITLSDVDKFHQTETWNEQLEKIKPAASKEAADTISKYITEGDYRYALQAIASLPDALVNSQIREIETNAVALLSEQVQNTKNTGKLDDAIAMLRDDNGNLLSPMLQELFDSISNERNINILRNR